MNDAVATALQNNPTIKAARAKWESAKQKVPQEGAWEDQTVSSYQADYETDKTTLIQVLTAENNLRQLETMYNQDLTDYRVAIAELESLIGADLDMAGPNAQRSNRGTK